MLKRAKRPVRERKVGWTSTDLLVAAIALGVLAASVIGLFWLFRGD